MNCRQFQNRMVELLDRDEDAEATAELSAHAGECPACAAELAAARAALDTVTLSRIPAAPARFKEKLMARIEEIPREASSLPLVWTARPRARWSSSRRTALGRFASWGLGAAALLAAGAYVLTTGSGAPAFAQVIERLAKARSLTYMAVSSQRLSDTPVIIRYSYLAPGRMRTDTGTQTSSIMDSVRRKGIFLSHDAKSYSLMDLSQLGAGLDLGAGSILENLRTLADKSGKPGVTKEADGRRLQSYNVETPRSSYVIWADAVSGEIVSLDWTLTDGPLNDPKAEQTHGTFTDFVLNPDLEESLFALEPPAGYQPLSKTPIVARVSTEADLIASLRIYAEAAPEKRFPESLTTRAMTDHIGKVVMARSVDREAMPTMIHQLTRGNGFIAMMFPENEFRYAGAGVVLGDASTPICSYKPRSSPTYRVIYGDLSVQDAAAPPPLPGAKP